MQIYHTIYKGTKCCKFASKRKSTPLFIVNLKLGSVPTNVAHSKFTIKIGLHTFFRFTTSAVMYELRFNSKFS